MRRAKYWILPIAALLVALALLPIPLPLRRALPAMTDQGIACEVQLDGWYFLYLFKPDVFEGSLSAAGSGLNLPEGARARMTIDGGQASLTFWREEPLQAQPGPAAFADTLLRRLALVWPGENGVVDENCSWLCAPPPLG